MTAIECQDQCNRIYYVIGETFDIDGFNGIYYCPRCKSPKIRVLTRPAEIYPPKITIRKEGNTVAIVTLGKPQAASVVKQSGQGQTVPGEQLPGARLRDDESRKGSRQEPEKQAPSSFLESGTRSPYEEEVSKYLGVKCDPKFIF